MSFFNKLVVFILPIVPKFITYLFAKRYIAGSHLNDAISLIKRLNRQNIFATIDILGEDIPSREDALKIVTDYKKVLAEIKENNIDSNISVKPTHLGLKIDKEFITDIDTNRNARIVYKTISDLASKLELKVVSEGIETENQLNALMNISHSVMQGYHFSRPLSLTQFSNYMTDINENLLDSKSA